jgi:hypothetical protein
MYTKFPLVSFLLVPSHWAYVFVKNYKNPVGSSMLFLKVNWMNCVQLSPVLRTYMGGVEWMHDRGEHAGSLAWRKCLTANSVV